VAVIVGDACWLVIWRDESIFCFLCQVSTFPIFTSHYLAVFQQKVSFAATHFFYLYFSIFLPYSFSIYCYLLVIFMFSKILK
jgi:hypothetical protein